MYIVRSMTVSTDGERAVRVCSEHEMRRKGYRWRARDRERQRERQRGKERDREADRKLNRRKKTGK